MSGKFFGRLARMQRLMPIEVAFNTERADALGVVMPAAELAKADRVFGVATKGR